MADRMDVNPRTAADDTLLNDGGHRMIRARSADAIMVEDDLIDILEPRQEGFSPVPPEGQSGRTSKEPPVSKDKKSIPQRFLGFFTGSSSPEGSQQRPHDTNNVDLQSSLDEEQKTNPELKKAVKKAQRKTERLEKKIQSASKEIHGLVQKINDAEEACQAMSNYSESLETQLESEKRDHRKNVSQLEDQIRTLTRTSDQLRQMLVPVSEKQTHDMDVVSKFNNLNKSIIGLTRQTWTTALKPGVDFRQLSGRKQELLGAGLPITYDRLQSLIFFGINCYIFGPQRYFLGQGFKEMEEHIKEVEKDLNRNMAGDDRQRILEWRDATFKVTESFRDHGSHLSWTGQNEIWDFFSSIQVRDAAAEREGRRKLKTICDNAAELSVMIRQLKDDFKIDNLDGAVGKPVSYWEEWAEEYASIPAPAGVQPGTIAYVIHGALIKSPKENLERTLVLQKAEVAVFQ